MSEHTWLESPVGLDIADREIHVWRTALKCDDGLIDNYRNLLTEDERARANRFRLEEHKDRFTIRRGILRVLIGRYLNQGPYGEPFPLNEFGKPRLPTVASGLDLRFNVSHSSGMALLAFAHNREIGVDVEAIRPDIDYCALATRFFSPTESSTLLSLPPNQRSRAFFAGWSRKEAYIKARGMGLSMPLDQFDVSIRPGEPAKILAIRDVPENSALWSLWELAPGPGFAGALAAEGVSDSVSCWNWRSDDLT